MYRLLSLVAAALALNDVAAQQTCYYPDGAVAVGLVACDSTAASSACCPIQGAAGLYPLDYPVCTPDGLCKAGNSDFLARGGCTDKLWENAACPEVCRKENTTGMAGTTACGSSSGWLCCNADHDAGLCACDPPAGTAFRLTGSITPEFFANVGNSTRSVSASAAASATAAATDTAATDAAATTAATTAAGQDSTTGSTTPTTTAEPPLTLTVYTTLQPSDATGSGAASASETGGGGLSAAGTDVPSSTTATPRAPVSSAGAVALGEAGTLAGIAVGIAGWLLA